MNDEQQSKQRELAKGLEAYLIEHSDLRSGSSELEQSENAVILQGMSCGRGEDVVLNSDRYIPTDWVFQRVIKYCKQMGMHPVSDFPYSVKIKDRLKRDLGVISLSNETENGKFLFTVVIT